MRARARHPAMPVFRRACQALLDALLSGFATVVFAAARGSIVTGGPPSVAILVEAMSASAEAGGRRLFRCCRGSFARWRGDFFGRRCRRRCRYLGFVRGGRRDGLRRRGLLPGRTFRGRISGLAVSGGDEFPAAARRSFRVRPAFRPTSGSAGVAMACGSAGSAVTSVQPASGASGLPGRLRYSPCAAAGSWSGAFSSAAGGSTRSIARTGCRWFRCRCAKTGSGLACHDGVLANSSCAARSNAAAPNPKTSIDIDNTIAANRKRKPGSMDASSAFAGFFAKAFEQRERGDDKIAAFATRRHRQRAANQADFRIPQGFAAFDKNRRDECPADSRSEGFPRR